MKIRPCQDIVDEQPNLEMPQEYWLPCETCKQKGWVVHYSYTGAYGRAVKCKPCGGFGWVRHIESIKLIHSGSR